MHIILTHPQDANPFVMPKGTFFPRLMSYDADIRFLAANTLLPILIGLPLLYQANHEIKYVLLHLFSAMTKDENILSS